jgi:putative tryptophan/tyrosine transport system substrate-binding protein
MRRRDFIALASNAVAVWPLGALAQEPGKIWRMGFIAQGYEKFYDALFEGLRELGYAEGRNLIVERRYAEGRAERFPEFAAEMVRLKVDIIVVSTTPAALAVKNATTTIPVVFPNAISPVESGVVASLAHPGGNVTGGRGPDRDTQHKAPRDPQGSGARTIARGGSLECGQPGTRIPVETDTRCGR